MTHAFMKAASPFLLALGLILPAGAQELPKPTFSNSLIIAIEDGGFDQGVTDYLKANFNFGLYARLSISCNHIPPVLPWHSDWTNAINNITGKTTLASLVTAVKSSNVGLHVVFCSGLARSLFAYNEAKQEDIRNGQWYNDNKIASDSQMSKTDLLDTYVFGTLSRYARKLRANHEAKGKAMLTYLAQTMAANPNTIITASGWGEAELNFRRMNDGGTIFTCDYSPFAVMEFRDWIQHTGMYDDATGKFKGEGYAGGVTAGGTPKYLGSSGLALFNADFGTAFTDWRLRYFDWNLGDDYDTNPQDSINADPHRIPLTSYVHGGMMPTSGASFIAGGFDPPRVRADGNPFSDLWKLFRHTMLRNFVKEFSIWASQAGISPDKVYSHQIPADYLFGNNPSTSANIDRFITSASSLWTANNVPLGSMGVTTFDIKFGDNWFVRTSDYLIPDLSAQSPNWGIMEYDAETYPNGFNVPQSLPADILAQYLRAYAYNIHVINFYRWRDDPEHAIKGTNKEIALRDFVARTRDKARSPNLGIVFAPPKVIGVTAANGTSSGGGAFPVVNVQTTGKIWTGESWNWKDWGDFNLFKVYRGFTAAFTADDSSYIGLATGYTYVDQVIPPGSTLYYKMRAVNQAGVAGPASDAASVTTTGTSKPTISLSPTSLSFSGQAGAPVSASKTVQITNTGTPGSTLHWLASDDQTWLSVSPASGTGNGTLTVQVSTSGFPAGTYTGQVKVEDPNSFNLVQYVPVMLTISPVSVISLSVDKAALAFNAAAGKTSAAQTVAISNTGTAGTVLHWQATADSSWILLNPASGTGNGTLSVQTAGLAAGDYSGRIKIEDPNAVNSPLYVDVTVHVVVPPTPTLSLERKSFVFGGEAGKLSSTVQKTMIKNAGTAGSVLNWQASADRSWIVLGTTSGTGDGSLQIKIDATGLGAGTYSGQVRVEDPAAQNSPQTVAVSATVYAQGSDAAPFGSFDSPADGSTAAASVAVTGWALDDIEVTRIEIKRSPHVLDNPASVGTDGLIYVGDAGFVKNARPDVEASLPAFPNAYRAGWGYMMLTNFLPNGGNGTYVLHVFAYDGSGHKIKLGQKTFAVDNAHSVLPFGTIETPAQGGTASGASYINWGWALTPPPNTIPRDGKTIWVWVDGAPLGNPRYNNYRVDIASLFPACVNSNGAVGFYYIDTTKYADGTHIISWGLRDDAGNASGIGSRYFEIANAGGSGSPAAPAPDPALLREDRGRGLAVELVGPKEVAVPILGRVVLNLTAKGGSRFIGWAETPDRPLPIGSKLDEKTGEFTWSVGPGFFGRHVLHFAVTDGVGRSSSVEVTVNIGQPGRQIRLDKKPIR